MRTLLLALLLSSPAGAADWMDADGVRIPTPPPEHPRLYLRTQHLADLRRRLDHPILKPVWEDLQRRAQKTPQIRLELDALRYLLSHDPDLGRRTLAETLTTLEHANFDKDAQDISRAIGRMMVTGAIVYDWCYPLLTPDQKKAFIAQEVRLAKDMEVGYPPRDGSYLTGHGSEWMIMRDMLSAGVALYDDFPDMYRYAANHFFKGQLPGRNFWYAGHAFHQGSAYAETRVSSELYPLWIFDRMGFPNIYSPEQQFLPYSWLYMRRPDNQLLRSGDGQSKVPKLRSLLIASYYKDGYILGDYLRTPGIDPMNELFELLWRDPDLQPKPPTDLPLSRYMDSPYGWMVARTGWDADSVIAEMKVNIYNFVNHQHLDAGAFQLYYHGPLAIDSGLYEGKNGGYGSAHHRNYYQRTIAHNSLLVYDPNEKFERNGRESYANDGGQRLPNGWREPNFLDDLLKRGYQTGKVLAHGFGPDPRKPEFTWLSGDLTAAYSAKTREVTRSFVFLNLGPGPSPAALVVFDRIVSADPALKKTWLLHSMEEPKIQDNTSTLSLTQRGWTGRLVNTTLLPEIANADLRKIGGPGREFVVGDVNYPNQPSGDPDEYETGAWRIELSPRTAATTDVFLNVMQVAGTSTAALPRPERLTSDGMTGVRIADRVVLFPTSSAQAAGPLSFEVRGSGTVKILVTGLDPGNWKVIYQSQPLAIRSIVDLHPGVVYFEGLAGGYQMRK